MMNHCSEECPTLRKTEQQRDDAGAQLDAADKLAEAAEAYLVGRLQAGLVGPQWLEVAQALDAYRELQETDVDPELRALLDETAQLEVTLAQ